MREVCMHHCTSRCSLGRGTSTSNARAVACQLARFPMSTLVGISPVWMVFGVRMSTYLHGIGNISKRS